MDVVVKSVVMKAVELGGQWAKDFKAYADKQYCQNEYIKKAVDGSVKACKSAADGSVKAYKNAESRVRSISRDIGAKVGEYSRKCRESDLGKSINKSADETSAIVREGLEKGRDAIESSRLFYQLGKLVYQQAVSPDHSSYTYPIVEKIHDIAVIKGEESILDNGGWSEDEAEDTGADTDTQDGNGEQA